MCSFILFYFSHNVYNMPGNMVYGNSIRNMVTLWKGIHLTAVLMTHSVGTRHKFTIISIHMISSLLTYQHMSIIIMLVYILTDVMHFRTIYVYIWPICWAAGRGTMIFILLLFCLGHFEHIFLSLKTL